MKQTSSVEDLFLEFMAERQSRELESLRRHYLALKKHFHPQGNRFRHLSEEFIRLHDFFFNIDHQADSLKLNQYQAYIGVFRLLSYSVGRASVLDNIGYFSRLALGGQLKRALCQLRRELQKRFFGGRPPDVIRLLEDRFSRVTIVDYGSGLAYQSIEMALKLRDRLERLVLLDIPSLISDFACYRAEREGIPVERIEVSADNQYPSLPRHQVCVANEVVEHVREPLRLLDNIAGAQVGGALLQGDFNDHCPEIFHLHTDLAFFRNELRKTHQPLGRDWYERRPE